MNKTMVKFSLSGLLLTASALICSAGGGAIAPLNAPNEETTPSGGLIKVNDELSLSWRDFVTAVDNIGQGVTNGEVAAAYEAYKAAASNTQLKKAAYDAAKKAYDDAEAQLAEWQNTKKTKDSELSALKTTLDAKNKAVTDLEAEIKTLESTIATNQTTYDNWPQEDYKELTGAAAENASLLQTFLSRYKNNTGYMYYKKDSSSLDFYITAYPSSNYDSKTIETGSSIHSMTSGSVSTLKSYINSGSKTDFFLFRVYTWYIGANKYASSVNSILSFYVSDKYLSDGGVALLETEVNKCIESYYNKESNYTIKQRDVSTYSGWSSKTALKSKIDSDKSTLTSKRSALTTAKSQQTTAQTNYNNKKAEVDAVQAQIDGYTKVQSGKTESEQSRLVRLTHEAQLAYSQAKEDEAEARLVYAEKLLALNEDKANNPLMAVTLTGDVVADVTLSDYAGTINGAGFTITAGEGVDEVFTGLTGTLKNTAINGAFTASEATIHNVAYWDGTNSGAYYANDGAKTEYHDLGELGFNIRKSFGVDFAENKLTALDETNKDLKVYHLTPYLGPGTEQTTGGYYQLKSGGTDGSLLVNAEGQTLTVPANHFILSSTADVADIALPNVFYQSNKSAEDAEPAYVSNLVEVDLGGESFYCPVNLTAKAVSVKGTIKTSNQRAGLCLPFALKPAYFPAGTSLCTFNRDNGPSFVFTKIAGDIAANTPVLIFSDQAEFELDFTGADMIHIARTPDDQIVKAGHDASGSSQSYGTFKAVTAGEIGQHEAGDWKVYALLNGKFTAAKQGNFTDDHVFDDVTGYGNVAKFKPFRMVITTKTEAGTGGSTNAPRFISIVDEQGNEIDNTAVIDCLGDATNGAFGVEGGAGLITITADADLGTVEIHDLAGRTVAVPDVKAGVTTVSVPGGVYVVAGTKVLVK